MQFRWFVSLRNARGVPEVNRVVRKIPRMSQDIGDNKNKVYKVVLTGGPCGGKTTGQARLCTFFESLGWKVYRAQETALVLMSGGIKFTELSKEDAYKFQENLIKSMMQIENTYFDLAQTCQKNCLVICDRGIMDGSAYLPTEDWERMRADNNWSEVHIRDNRYNQVIHMVSSACGAEAFYTCAGHKTRHEDIDVARNLDKITAQAWVGHPYYDVVDNSTDFDDKINRMINTVCHRLGIDTGDRLQRNTRKRKFLVKCMPDEQSFPPFQDFTVIHDYLVTPSRKMQARLRKRGQGGVWTYTHTIRRPEINKQSVEMRMAINVKDYNILLNQKDENHATIQKQRRCFLWKNQYFQMDIYREPCPDKCKGLILLETYTTKSMSELELPDFLQITEEVTDDHNNFSMFNLSLKDSLLSSPSRTRGLFNDSPSHAKPLTNTGDRDKNGIDDE
ncbi:TRPL translocation defect protein 14-like [Mya arenaria]|uniref:TRPL translocation defect protein 14-like n=1 Tax=Mya arenaria TaxID=6604 RepID=UPI0022E4DFFB|nr:TRPL translocation defect protein 14-like [Mya arenaria]